MKNKFSVLRSKGVKFTAAVAASAMAFAANNPVFAIGTAEITAAQEAGVSAVTLAVAGLIGIVAVIIGVNIVLSVMKKA